MESVQDLINLILWDRRLVLLPDGKIIVILNPTVADRNIAALEKRLVMQQALNNEVPTQEMALKNARESEDWTDEDDLILKEAEKHIAFLQSEKDRQKLLSKKNRLDKQIEETQDKLRHTLEKQQYIYTLSAEYMANEAFIYAMMRRVVLYEDGVPFFDHHQTINDLRENNPELTTILLKEVVTEGALPHAELRRVARSLEWRMLWTLNRENTQSLFSTPVANLSANQRMLIYWSRVYDLAYESTEKPDEEVIQDDEKFDTWLRNRSNEKSESEMAKKKNVPEHHERGVILDGYYIEECICGVAEIKVKGHGERPKHATNCMYGTYRKYTRAEKDKIADDVYARNPRRIRMLQTQEQMTVAKVGMIDEKDLRNRNSRMLLGSKQEVHQLRK
jgi:hypothetical protein